MPEEMPEFARTLRERCERAKLTQSELARMVGVGQSQISNIMWGRNLPSLPLYVKICRALGIKRLPLIPDHA
jgi:transcriptional regulator with XRE-family HTH domain